MQWQGDEAGLLQLCQLFELGSSPNNELQQQAFRQLQHFSQLPDFDLYLATIFAKMLSQQEVVRQRAGLLLKESLRCNAQSLVPQVAEFIQLAALSAVRDQSRVIRQTAGTLLTTIVQRVGVQSCLQTLDKLVECLGDSHMEIAEGCCNALSKICEDGIATLQEGAFWFRKRAQQNDAAQQEAQSFVNWCTARLLPHIVEYASPSASLALRQNALECLNHFALNHLLTDSVHTPLHPFAPKYLEVLGILANDTDTRVMCGVCKGFVCVVENNWECLRPEHCQIILSYMLNAAQHPEYEVRLEALEVWSPCIESQALQQMVAPMLPTLVPALLANMVYSSADYMGMEQSQIDDDNSAVPDSQQDMKPRFKRARAGDDDDEDDENDNLSTTWTARRAAASSLEKLASTFQSDILRVVLPLIEQKLQDANWDVQESAVLALGAIASGCMEDLVEFLPKVIQLLLILCEGQKPLLRSSSCWCASRFSPWVCSVHNPGHPQVMCTVLEALLKRCLDRNKRVQEAAISALATLEEEAQRELVPFLPQIVQTLVEAFRFYQARNLIILYDAVGALAESVQSDLAEPRYVEALMIPIMNKFEQTPDNDSSLVALFECLTSLTQHMGEAIVQLAPRLAVRSVTIISHSAAAAQMWQMNPHEVEKPDREAMAASISLLSGLFEGMGAQVKLVLAQHNFLAVLPSCMKDPSLQVRQCAFALMGDSAKSCFEYLLPFLPELLKLCEKNLWENNSASVCNNASWAIGEVCIQAGPEVMTPHAETLVAPLVTLLARLMVDQRSSSITLAQNICITLGRLGSVCVRVMGKSFPEFARNWCLVMKDVRQDDEKITAFQGLYCLIKANPQACMSCTPDLAIAIASFRPTPPQLHAHFKEILQFYKQLQENRWPAVFSQLPMDVQGRLQQEYTLL